MVCPNVADIIIEEKAGKIYYICVALALLLQSASVLIGSLGEERNTTGGLRSLRSCGGAPFLIVTTPTTIIL